MPATTASLSGRRVEARETSVAIPEAKSAMTGMLARYWKWSATNEYRNGKTLRKPSTGNSAAMNASNTASGARDRARNAHAPASGRQRQADTGPATRPPG